MVDSLSAKSYYVVKKRLVASEEVPDWVKYKLAECGLG